MINSFSSMKILILFCFVELYFERGTANKFLSLTRELEGMGTLSSNRVSKYLSTILSYFFHFVPLYFLFYQQTYPFEFSLEKPYESYR